MKIGVVGVGIVGGSVLKAFNRNNKHEVVGYDPNKKEYKDYSKLYDSDIIFICVPTPTNEKGKIDLSYVATTLYKLMSTKEIINKEPIIVIKSTVVPNTTLSAMKEHNYFNIVFNPEFLTEKAPYEDFINTNRIIVGTYKFSIFETIKQAYKEAGFLTSFFHVAPTEAELIKYVGNTFLAMKVIFANEYYKLCKELNVDFDKIMDLVSHDERIGNSHFKVPGSDGKFGFGGKCFPKDTKAIVKASEKFGINLKLLKRVLELNEEVRYKK